MGTYSSQSLQLQTFILLDGQFRTKPLGGACVIPKKLLHFVDTHTHEIKTPSKYIQEKLWVFHILCRNLNTLLLFCLIRKKYL